MENKWPRLQNERANDVERFKSVTLTALTNVHQNCIFGCIIQQLRIA